MLKLAALFATAIAALQCVVAERALIVEPRVAATRVISSDANARLLKLGFNNAVAIDLPMDVKEMLIADPQTVRVILRTARQSTLSARPWDGPISFSTPTTAGRSSPSTFLYRKRRNYHRPSCEMFRSGNR